jgi:hypothetical protein
MRFTPKSEAEAQGLFADGLYPATVTKAEEKTSKGGNEMIALDLTCYRDDGAEVEVKDWLGTWKNGIAKIRHFCESAGILDLYEAGELNADTCNNQNVYVKLVVEEDDFGVKNKVIDYRNGPQSEPIAEPKLPGVPAQQTRAAMKSETNSNDCPF